MGKTVLILMSHGNMAKETLKSAEMIIGKVDNVYDISMPSDMGPENVKFQLKALINNNKDAEKILILTDLLGGTPCNVAFKESCNYQNVTVFAGLSLPMVIEAIMARETEIEIEALKERIIQVAKESTLDISTVLNDIPIDDE